MMEFLKKNIIWALLGVILVLALIAVIENIFFLPNQGLGLTKPIVFPGLITPN